MLTLTVVVLEDGAIDSKLDAYHLPPDNVTVFRMLATGLHDMVDQVQTLLGMTSQRRVEYSEEYSVVPAPPNRQSD